MRRLGLVFLLATTQCSWCAAPKPSTEDDPTDRDAAPRADVVQSRCEQRSTLSLPGAFALGRVAAAGTRVFVGARRGRAAGVLTVDGVTARFTETGENVGDDPPPLPLVSGKATLVLAYEGAAGKRRLVLRDVAAPSAPIVSLPPEPADDSLAYDATAQVDGSIAIAWDAPAETGSAIFATLVRGGGASAVARVSPEGTDADSPRLAPFGPNVLVTWLAHRALPKTADAAPALEGPAQDLEHAWVEMLPVDETFHATAPLRRLTPDTGRVTFFDAVPRGGVDVDVVARDAIELEPGQGGTALLVTLAGPDVRDPVVVATHVGRGLPFVTGGLALYDDPSDLGRAAASPDSVSAEPTLDGARVLWALPSGELLVAPEGAGPDPSGTTELRIVRCRPK